MPKHQFSREYFVEFLFTAVNKSYTRRWGWRSGTQYMVGGIWPPHPFTGQICAAIVEEALIYFLMFPGAKTDEVSVEAHTTRKTTRITEFTWD